MENQNVCKNCGGVKIAASAETKTPETGKGNVCKDCDGAVKSGTEHEHEKEK